MNNSCLLPAERAIFDFRSLYQQYGYSRFKMSRFEQYDLYVRNKDFLVSDRMITFTDSNGTLLALKPDVTISIIKNTTGASGGVRKLYYNENVYRAGKGESSFKEITQTGLECIGDVDLYNICEVIMLAVKSLELISEKYILDISHMGLVSGLIHQAGIDETKFSDVLKCVREKNSSGLMALCDNDAQRDALLVLTSVYGPMDEVLQQLHELELDAQAIEALGQLDSIYSALKVCGLDKNVRIDFSVVNDMNYYNGIVFQGFIKGVPSGVLSGGQYDRLMRNMGKDTGAIGFAVYLDELEVLGSDEDPYDADIVLLYDETDDVAALLAAVEQFTAKGSRVLPRTAVPEKLRYRRLINIKDWRDENV